MLTYERSPIENMNSVYSVGTAIAINSLEQHYSESKHEMLVISINTLLRNIIEKDMDVNGVIERFNIEIPVLLNEVTSIIGNQRPDASVLLYAIDYKKCLPAYMFREDTPHRVLLEKCVQTVISKRVQFFGENGTGNFNKIPVKFKHINNSITFPYESLSNTMKMLSPARNAILVSHNPVDFHIIKYYNTILLESHTGEWKQPKDWNIKVFGDRYKEVPFTPTTHFCLGDKPLLTPFLSRGNINILLDRAHHEMWRLKSREWINSKLIDAFKLPIKEVFR